MDDGYCEHGVYVGGCGIDWMCGYCESGISLAELQHMNMRERVSKRVTREVQRWRMYVVLAKHGVSPDDIAGYIHCTEI